MGEWRRVFGNPRRLAALGLIVLLSAVFFVVERMDYFGRDSISVLLDGERYYAGLTARLRGQSPEDIGQFLADEEQLLNDYSNYLFAAANGVDPTESMSASPEEVEAAAREHVYLSALKDMDDAAAHRRIDVAASRVQELRDEAKHIAGYADYLDNIQAQAERQVRQREQLHPPQSCPHGGGIRRSAGSEGGIRGQPRL